jgi:hypothetical protein
MQPAMPFMFVRYHDTFGDGSERKSTHVVMLAPYWDLRNYDCAWMGDPVLGDGKADAVFVPDVDISEKHWVFDAADSLQNELDALAKMKELWAAMVIPTAEQIRSA